jgi:hypothetical protein
MQPHGAVWSPMQPHAASYRLNELATYMGAPFALPLQGGSACGAHGHYMGKHLFVNSEAEAADAGWRRSSALSRPLVPG